MSQANETKAADNNGDPFVFLGGSCFRPAEHQLTDIQVLLQVLKLYQDQVK